MSVTEVEEMIRGDIEFLRDQAVQWAAFYKGMGAVPETAPFSAIADHLEGLLERIGEARVSSDR